VTTTSGAKEPIEPHILPGAVAEAERRWPDSGIGPHDRWWNVRRGFRQGAMWAFGQPTDDARLEGARRAGQMEALDAIKGYLTLQTKNIEGSSDFKHGVWALSGRLHHMIAEAKGQIVSEVPAPLVDGS
jgi:hypothetical protein